MKEVDYVQKKGRNAHFGYNYAREEDILAAVREKLLELQLVIFTSIKKVMKTGDITEIFTEHTIVDVSTGKERKIEWYGQGQDKNDKGSGKAETNDGKYFLLKNLLIPTGDDPEANSPEPNGKNPAKNGRNGTAPKNGAAPTTGQKPVTSKNSADESTAEQQAQIKKLAQEVGLNIENDILAKLKIAWPPNKKDADRILKRLNELSKDKK